MFLLCKLQCVEMDFWIRFFFNWKSFAEHAHISAHIQIYAHIWLAEWPTLVQVHLAPGSPNETCMDEIPEWYSSISDSFVFVVSWRFVFIRLYLKEKVWHQSEAPHSHIHRIQTSTPEVSYCFPEEWYKSKAILWKQVERRIAFGCLSFVTEEDDDVQNSQEWI